MTTEEQAAVKVAADEAADDVKLVMEVVAALKAKDKAAAIALLPKVLTEVKEDVAAYKAVAPVIKAGHKTSEFWIVAAVIVAVAVVPAITGKPLPIDSEAILGVVASIYAIARTFAKRPADTVVVAAKVP